MPIELFIVLPVALLVLVACLLVIFSAPKMNMVTRILAALVFASVALFSAFGFAASIEPGDNNLFWSVGYVTLFLACLLSIGRLLFAKSDHTKIDQP